MTSFTRGFFYLRSPSVVLSWISHDRRYMFRKSHWWTLSSSSSSSSSPSSKNRRTLLTQKHHKIILSQRFTLASNQHLLDIEDTTTFSHGVSDIVEPKLSQQESIPTTYLNDTSLPLLVQNVSTWLDTLNIPYNLCAVPLSSIIIPYNNTTQPPPPESQITLYIVRFIIHHQSTIKTTVEKVNVAAPTNQSPPHPSQRQQQEQETAATAIVLLHLLPSPTSLQNCVPAGVTQYMTDHPQIVVRSLQNITSDNNGENLQKNTTASTTTTAETNDSNIRTDNIQIIHLHEDTWIHNRTKPIVQSRLLFRLGIRAAPAHRRIYARQTIAKRIDSLTARNFLLQHHLWGTTHSKYSYGLYDKPTTRKHNNNDNDTNNTVQGQLVAVATFSSRRNVRRGQGQEQRIYHSYELIRTCSCSDTSIVGGISKLISAFIKDNSTPDKPVDDIVTVIDRDWGIGQSNWYTLGFRTVATMLPIPMVIASKDGTRRHLIGAGIQSEDNPNYMDMQKVDAQLIRFGLPTHVLSELEMITSYNEAIQCLHRHGYYLIYDAGVERLLLLVSQQPEVLQKKEYIQSIWDSSSPQYAAQHYSHISGIDAIIKHVAKRNYD